MQDAGIKIKADGAAEFNQQLKDITATSKALDAELKSAKSSYDSSESAQQKLEKQSKILTEAMENQQKKIDLLKQKVAESSQAYGENDSKTMKWRESLAKAETAMGSMKDEQAKLKGGVEDVGKAEDEAAEKTSRFGDVLKANLTSDAIEGALSALKDGIVNLGNAAVDAWHDIDDGADTITTKTGATGEALQDMQDRMKSIATTIPTDFETAGTAIGEVNTRFGLTGDALEKLSTQFIQFANINGTDVNGSIDATQKALDAFGLTARDAGAVLDAINVAGQNTGISVDKLTADLTSNATAFQGLGFNMQDSINLLATLEKSGVDTSVVMTGLSKVQQKAAKDGKSMGDELSTALGSAQDAIDIFGAKAGPKLYESFQNGTLSIKDFTAQNESLISSMGSVSDTYNATLDPIDQFTMAQNQMKEVGADLVDAVMPKIIPFLDQITEYIQNIDVDKISEAINGIDVEGVADQFGNLLESVSNVVNFVLDNGDAIQATILGVTAAMATMQIGSFIGSMGSLVPALAGVGAVIGGPVALAIGAAVAVGVVLYKNWDTIKEKAGELKDAIGEKWNAVKDATSQTWDNIKTSLSTTWDNMKTTASQTWGNIKSTASTAWNAVKDTVSTVAGAMKDTASEKLNNIKAAFEENGGGVKGIVSAAWEGIKGYYTFGFDTINTLTGGKLDSIKQAFEDKMNLAKDAVGAAIDKIKGFFDFDWHLPSLKLPHISITGQWSLKPPSAPHFDVDWYAKAMQQGMILNNPTIFGMDGSKLLGAGEAGPEVVVGASALTTMIQKAVSAGSGESVTINVYGAEGQDTRVLAEQIADIIDDRVQQRKAAFA